MHTQLSESHATSSGFTLIETLVAVLLISSVFGFFIDVIIRSVKVTKLSEQDVLASNLAFDGIELTRNRKDNAVNCATFGDPPTCDNWLTPFGPPLSTPAIGGSRSYIPDDDDTALLVGNTTFPVLNGPAPYLCRDATNRVVNCSGSLTRLAGNYQRVITVTKLSDYRVRVDSTVTWGAGNTYTASTLLFNVW
jgi:prepilin-type N-terminal cleavage/methylation domain-containing protein